MYHGFLSIYTLFLGDSIKVKRFNYNLYADDLKTYPQV
jgi:hypothetical protein